MRTLTWGLARNKDSAKAQDRLKGKENLELFGVDCNDKATSETAFKGANSLFLNVIVSQ